MKKQVFNPYLPSYEYIPDGEPRVFGNRLYIYGSHDRFNGDMYCQNDYVCYSAPVDDLSDWRYEGVIYQKTQDPFNPDGAYNMYAPDLVQGLDGRYYLYYGMDFYSRISVAVADTPTGPFAFLDYVRHADGRIYGDDLENDPFQFDPGVLVDDDKRIYLYTGFAPAPEIVAKVKEIMGISLTKIGNHVVELEADMITLKSAPKQVIPNVWDGKGTSFEGHEFFEASSMRKLNGKYYFIYSTFLSHELAYAISDSPTEGFVFGGVLHSNADLGVNGYKVPQNYWGNNHGSIASINGKYYIFGHRQTNQTEFSRQGVAEELQMTEQGHFNQAELTSCGLNGGPLKGKGTYPAAIACHLMGPNGAIKSVEVATVELKKEHPYITQELADGSLEDSQYICNMRDGALAGYKYFEFSQLGEVTVETSGTGQGQLVFSLEKGGEAIASVDVSESQDWVTSKANVTSNVTGKQALYVTFKGQGSLNFKCFRLD
ncbi:family 43 glycosylhydrolase [Streptococcus plurextorum]|uniref:family 43 glycosylhydrolase n=1 Tax=Streptococcus plurextorum TaxID=456876 RepID=UPI00040139A0|nr:family 43 glycosylhydrolase [Streptococcus plurextorum]